jgi:hypothetical protein
MFRFAWRNKVFAAELERSFGSSKVAVTTSGASDDVEPHRQGWSRTRWLGVRRLRERAVNRLKSLARANLCVRLRRSSLGEVGPGRKIHRNALKSLISRPGLYSKPIPFRCGPAQLHSSTDWPCIFQIQRRAHGLSGLETKPRDDRSRAPVLLHNIRRIRQ